MSLPYLACIYMKFRVKIIFLGMAAMWSCKGPSIVISPENEIKPFPYLAENTGVNVRIKNTGNLAFTYFSIKLDNGYYTFRGLKPGEVSAYKAIPYLWTNNSCSVWYRFSKQKKGVAGRLID